MEEIEILIDLLEKNLADYAHDRCLLDLQAAAQTASALASQTAMLLETESMERWLDAGLGE